MNCLESSAFVHWNTLYDDHDVDLLNLEYTCYNELNVPLDGVCYFMQSVVNNKLDFVFLHVQFPKVFKPCTQANSGWSMELNETGHHCVYGGCAKLFEDRGCSFQMNRLNATCSFGSLGMYTETFSISACCQNVRGYKTLSMYSTCTFDSHISVYKKFLQLSKI